MKTAIRISLLLPLLDMLFILAACTGEMPRTDSSNRAPSPSATAPTVPTPTSTSTPPLAPGPTPLTSASPLHISTENPRYLAGPQGNIIFLSGWDHQDQFVAETQSDPPAHNDYTAWLSEIKNFGGNFQRLWPWRSPKEYAPASGYWYTIPQPWVRNGSKNANDGKPKFDLATWNESYFDDLRTRVLAANNAGVYTDVMLFEGWWHSMEWNNEGHMMWAYHPFNSANNIQGIGPATAQDFYCIPDTTVEHYQKAYIAKVVDTLNDVDAIVWEIANEAPECGSRWQEDMISYLRSYEAGKAKRHVIGKTCMLTKPLGQAADTTLTNSSADWIAPCYRQGARDWYDPPLAGNGKLRILLSDHISPGHDTSEVVWKIFTRGYQFVSLKPPTDAVRYALGDVRTYASKMDLKLDVPTTAACSTQYCLSSAGVEFLVYAPSGGAFTVDLSGNSNNKAYSVEWFNPSTRVTSTAAKKICTSCTSTELFTSPFGTAASVLYLSRGRSSAK